MWIIYRKSIYNATPETWTKEKVAIHEIFVPAPSFSEAVWSEGFNPRSQRLGLQRLKPLLHRLRPGARALLLEAV